MAIALFFYSFNVNISQDIKQNYTQCASPKLTNPLNQRNTTSPETYYYTGDPVTFSTVPFEVEPSSCQVSYSCSMSLNSIVDLCNYQKGTTKSSFDSETGLFTFESNDIANFGSQILSFTVTASSGDASAQTSFQLELINPCFIAELDISTDIIADQIQYDIYANNDALQIDIDPYYVTLQPPHLQSAISLCGEIELNIVRNDRSNILRRLDRIFSFIQTSEESKLIIETQDYSDAGSYQFLLLASFKDRQYSQMSKRKFEIELIDYCAGSTIADIRQPKVTDPEVYKYDGEATYTPTPYEIRPKQCQVSFACQSSVPGLCDVTSENTNAFFDTLTGEFSFISSDIQRYETQSIEYFISAQSEGFNRAK